MSTDSAAPAQAQDRQLILNALNAWPICPRDASQGIIRIIEGKRPQSDSPAFFLEHPRLIAVLKGKAIFRTVEHNKDVSIAVSKGQMLLLGEGTWICPVPDASYQSLGIILRKDSTRLTLISRESTRKEASTSAKYLAQFRTNDTLGERGHSLLSLLKIPPPEQIGEASTITIAKILFAELEHMVRKAPQFSHELQLIHWQAVCDYISEHWSDPALSREMVANFFQRHPNYFSRLFHAHAKCNFRAYVNELRLQRSLILLRDLRHNVTDVAAFCGFTHLQYFIRCFRERFGISPGQYRKRYEN